MVDRYRVWLGAGFLAGGMSAAMLTGAGVATADDGAPAGSESQPASGTKDSGESDQDASGPGKAASSTGADKPGKHRKDDDDADAVSVPDGDDDVSVDDGDGSDVSDGSDGSEVSDLGDVEDQDDEDADDLEQEMLITYPVERDRLDVFTRFLDPLDIEPASVRTAELTPMIIQLVASGRGVTCLPNWALTEYLEQQTIIAKKLGESGLWCTLYAAIREDQSGMAFMRDFLTTASETCFSTLNGIKVVESN